MYCSCDLQSSCAGTSCTATADIVIRSGGIRPASASACGTATQRLYQSLCAGRHHSKMIQLYAHTRQSHKTCSLARPNDVTDCSSCQLAHLPLHRRISCFPAIQRRWQSHFRRYTQPSRCPRNLPFAIIIPSSNPPAHRSLKQKKNFFHLLQPAYSVSSYQCSYLFVWRLQIIYLLTTISSTMLTWVGYKTYKLYN